MSYPSPSLFSVESSKELKKLSHLGLISALILLPSATFKLSDDSEILSTKKLINLDKSSSNGYRNNYK
jgi:hypothetical protein